MNPESNDIKIINSWKKNSLPWILAVRKDLIESRKRITNQAIIESVLNQTPKSVLDVGCGEGWLMRELKQRNIVVIGVDASDDLVEAARRAGSGDVRLMSYEQIASGGLDVSVDAMVCNFSLLGKESVEGIFEVALTLLNPNGLLIVQTLHPLMVCGDFSSYQDGWREGSWVGCGDGFSEPAPWYFRTLENWKGLFTENGLQLIDMLEPIHPGNGQLASVIFIGKVN